MGADVIIYSIAEGEYIAETQAALDFIQQEASHFTSQKMFILVSFCLTWNKTKPLDIDDPEIPFTEDDYRLVLVHGTLPLIFFSESAGHQQIIKTILLLKNWQLNLEKHWKNIWAVMLSVLVSVMEMANRHFIRSSNKPGLANNPFQSMEQLIMVSTRAPRTI